MKHWLYIPAITSGIRAALCVMIAILMMTAPTAQAQTPATPQTMLEAAPEEPGLEDWQSGHDTEPQALPAESADYAPLLAAISEHQAEMTRIGDERTQALLFVGGFILGAVIAVAVIQELRKW